VKAELALAKFLTQSSSRKEDHTPHSKILSHGDLNEGETYGSRHFAKTFEQDK